MKLQLDSPDQIIISFEKAERFLAIKKALTIPRTSITDIVSYEEYNIAERLVRVGGTSFPGVLHAGRFRANSGALYFLYLKKPSGLAHVRAKHVTEITTQNDDGNPLTIVLTLSDEASEKLLSWYTTP